MSHVDWLIVVEGVAGGAAVVSAVVAVVGAVSARAERKGAEEAAESAKRHMEAAESGARAMTQIAGSLDALADQGALVPLGIINGCVTNVSGAEVIVQGIANAGAFKNRRPPLDVPVVMSEGDTIELRLDQRSGEPPAPASLSLVIQGRTAPLTLPLDKPPGRVWFF
jgi:hypothetical protein